MPEDFNQTLHESNNNWKFKFEYDANDNPIYIGKAEKGTSVTDTHWQIQKLTYDANNNPTDIEWAEGTDEFIFVWNDRASYTYS
jgi:YD repeat-containing protein